MSAFHELEQANARIAELTEQNTKLRKALDGRRRETRRARRKLETARAERDLLGRQQQALLDLCHNIERVGGTSVVLSMVYEKLITDPADAAAATAVPRLATPDQIRDALRGGPLVDGVVYPTLAMDEALGHLADRVKPDPAVVAERVTVPRTLAPAEPKPTATTVPVLHGWTRHGYACCGQATVGERPTSIARCMGNPGCPKCKTDADQIHAGTTPPGYLANGADVYLRSGQVMCCKCDHPMSPTGVCSNTGRCPQAVPRA